MKTDNESAIGKHYSEIDQRLAARLKYWACTPEAPKDIAVPAFIKMVVGLPSDEWECLREIWDEMVEDADHEQIGFDSKYKFEVCVDDWKSRKQGGYLEMMFYLICDGACEVAQITLDHMGTEYTAYSGEDEDDGV